MATTKKLIAELSVETGQSKQNIEGVRTAVEALGSDGTQAVNKLTTPLENIERDFDKINNKIEAGRLVTQKDVGAMAQQFELLENQVRQTFGSIERAPAEMQTAFAKAETQLEHTRQKVRVLSDAVDDQKPLLKEAGDRWGGMGDAVERAAGKNGKFVASFGLVTAALTEGWNIGMKLNKFFGTDMTTFDSAIERVGQKGKIVITELSNELVAFGGVLKAVFTPGVGWADNILKAQQTFRTQLAESEGRIRDLDKTLADDEIQHRKNADASAKAAEKSKELAEEKKKLAEHAAAVAVSLAAENAELAKQEKAANSAKNQVIEQGANQQSYGIALSLATQKVEVQKRAVEALTKAYGDADPRTQAANDQLKKMQGQLDVLKKSYDDTSTSLKNYQDEQQKANAAIEEHKKKIAELGTSHANVEQIIKDATGTVNAAAAATGKAAAAVKGWYDANGQLHISNVETATSAAEAAAAAAMVGNKAQAASGAVKGWIDAQGHVHIANEQAAASASKAASATDSVKKATEGAAHAAEVANGAVKGWIDETGKIHLANDDASKSTDKATTATQNLASAQAAAAPVATSAATSADQLTSAVSQASAAIASTASQLDPALAKFRDMSGVLADINSQLHTMIDLLPQMAKASKDAAEAA